MLMLSLAGIPPLAGFFAKFYVFLAAMQAGLIIRWPCIGVVASVVGAYYYLRIVKIMYFDDPRAGVRYAIWAMALGAILVRLEHVLAVLRRLRRAVDYCGGHGRRGAVPVSTLACGLCAEGSRVVDSTNEEARRWPCRRARPGLDHARDARPRAGAAAAGPGISAPGNLAATLLIRPGRPAGECAQLSFVAALAVADTVAGFAPDAEIRVKWPNDVLADGSKIAGILLESDSCGPRARGLPSASASILRISPKAPNFLRPRSPRLVCGHRRPRDALAALAARIREMV